MTRSFDIPKSQQERHTSRQTRWPLRFLTLLALLLTAHSAAAWNDCGHMVVAAAAYQQLTPATRAKVDGLLRLNPQYRDWIADRDAGDRGEVAFLLAATWPDFIKRQPNYVNDGEQAHGPDAARNVGYADHAQHRYWHFVDSGFSPDGTAFPKTPAPNVTTQIAAFRHVLAARTASAELKSYDLVWLLHLVGDLHQPLHATSRYTQSLPRGDRGGNAVAICKSPCTDVLHGFWDGALGQCHSPNEARAIARNLPLPPPTSTEPSESKWQTESRNIAQTIAYRSIGLARGPVSLDRDYRREAIIVARVQAALAGARLANLLNDELR